VDEKLFSAPIFCRVDIVESRHREPRALHVFHPLNCDLLNRPNGMPGMSDQHDAALRSWGGIPATSKKISFSDFDFEIVLYPVIYNTTPLKKKD
jgi:hypothetical protein